MAAGFLSKMFGTHVACGCRPHMAMCGTYDPSITEIEVVSTDTGAGEKWCQPCLMVWFAGGCGNCGCNSEDLCSACYVTVEPEAD